ncbi:MAG: YihY/virulence factor BrkB family protein [Gammaproteobacteria bacterium]
MSLRQQLYEVWTLGGLPVSTLAKRVWKEINEDDVWGYAAQLAYYFLFSLFPFFIFLAALLAYIPIPNLLDQIMALLGQLLPATVLEMVQGNVLELVTQPRGGLLSLGILLALWTAASAIAAISDSLNRAYGVKEGRPFWRVRLIAVLLTIGLAFLMLSSMVLLIFGSELGSLLATKVGLGAAFDTAWEILRWPIIVFLMMFGAALIYYFAPDVEQEWRWITPGSAIAVLVWIAMSLLFAWYVDHFGNYSVTYGSIGAVIVLLTWMYFTGFFLLVGGEINAEIEHAAASGKAPGKKKLPT